MAESITLPDLVGWRFYSTFYSGSPLTMSFSLAFGDDGEEPPAPEGTGHGVFSALTPGAVGNLVPTEALFHGTPLGRLRTLFYDRSTDSGTRYGGLVALLSAESLLAEDGALGYAAVWESPARRVALVKLTAGFDPATWQVLATSADGLWPADTWVGLEFLWDAGQAILDGKGGPQFSLGLGVAVDYSLFSPVDGLTAVVDTTTPYTTNVNESVAAWCASAGARVAIDRTQRFAS